MFTVRVRTRLVWLPLLLCGLAACGRPGAVPDVVVVGAAGVGCDSATVARVLGDSAGSVVQPHRSLSEFLPNVRHALRDSPEPGQAVTDSVVFGWVTDVARDRGFVEGNPGTAGRPGAVATAYDDPDADWRTVRITVAVDEVLAGPLVRPFTVDVGLLGNVSTGENDSDVECALAGLGAVVVFSKALPDPPEFLGIPRHLPDEPFGVAAVASTGALHFPFATGGPGRTSDAFLGDLDTLEELRRAASQPDRTVFQQG